MSRTRLKLMLAIAGLAVFFLGARAGNMQLRWAGIGLVTAAWLLRFAGRASADHDSSTTTSEDPS